MSLLAVAASILLLAWLALSVLYAARVSAVGRWFNAFHGLGRWTMFSDPTGGQRAHSLEYRDSADRQWVRVPLTAHWRPLGWLLNPRRPAAEGFQSLARALDAAVDPAGVPRHDVIERAHGVCAGYVARLYPVPTGVSRDIRVVSTRGDTPAKPVWTSAQRQPEA
jgi:hypothetical protein